MILEMALLHYFKNFKAALAFALLLVFVPFFSMLESVFVSSGSMFIDYSMREINSLLFFIPAFAVFLALYSFLMAIIIFSVRKELSKVKLHFYLEEMIKKFTLKLFVFFLVFCLVLYAIASAMLFYTVWMPITALLLLIISLALMFVPQSIVIDEEGVFQAMLSNFDFIRKNPKSFIQVIIAGCALLAVASIVGEFFDQVFMLGGYVSLLLTMVFILPFLESMKTCVYMLKFELVRYPHFIDHRPRKERVVPAELKDVPAKF